MCCRPHAFKAVYTVTLHGEQLRTDFHVHNTGDQPFEFTAALHTYIEVLNIEVSFMTTQNYLLPLRMVSGQRGAQDIPLSSHIWS